MNKFIAAAFALLVSVGAANAQLVDSQAADRAGFYIGGAAGTTTERGRLNLGLTAGYQISPMFRVEGTYDFGTDAQAVMLNGVVQRRINNTGFTPYVLAGACAGFDNLGTKSDGDASALYNLGTGVRYAVSTSVELDVRYRYVGHFNSDRGLQDANVFTLGVNYRF